MNTLALLLPFTVFLCIRADLDYTSATQKCSTHHGPGMAVYCCDGGCLDGSPIGTFGSQCEYWMDLCGDLQSGPPSCSATQVLSYNDVPPTKATGDGCCGACCCECQYVRNQWAWSCCDCPARYKAVDAGQCDGPSGDCVGCSEHNEILSGNATAGWNCKPVCEIEYVDPDGNPQPCSPKQRGSCGVNAVCEPLTKNLTTCSMGGDCKMGAAGLAMLRYFEKGCPDFYTTTDGDDTIGWGHDCTQDGDCDDFNPPLSAGAMDDTLFDDLSRLAYLGAKSPGKWPGAANLNTNQFSAMVDYAFQNGAGGARSAFKSLVGSGDFAAIYKKLAKSQDARAQARAALWNNPTTQMSGC